MEVADEVEAAIAKELKIPLEQLSDDKKLADLGAESIDVIEIVFQLEERFNIDIALKMNPTGADVRRGQDQVGLSAFGTVGDFYRMVEALADARASK